MLVEMTRSKEDKLFQIHTPYAIATVIIGAFMVIGMFWKAWFNTSANQINLDPTIGHGLNVATQNSQAISRGLFTGYILPFEILSVILLVALVGAVLLTKIDTV
jgi:NADH-quinone oxidoreductase subunit J